MYDRRPKDLWAMTTLIVAAKSSKYLPLMFSNANVSGDDFGSASFWSFFGDIARKRGTPPSSNTATESEGQAATPQKALRSNLV